MKMVKDMWIKWRAKYSTKLHHSHGNWEYIEYIEFTTTNGDGAIQDFLERKYINKEINDYVGIEIHHIVVPPKEIVEALIRKHEKRAEEHLDQVARYKAVLETT